MSTIKCVDKVSVVVSFLLVALLAAAAGADGPGSCADAFALVADSMFRGSVAAEGRFALEIEAQGIVTVELSSATLIEHDARIGLYSPGCAGFHSERFGPNFVLLEEAATHVKFAALRPGTFFIGVASSDPLRSLGPVKIDTRFVETELRPRALKSRPTVAFLTFPTPVFLTKDEDHAVDPDPFAKSSPFEWTALVLSRTPLAKDEDHAVDPDPFAKGSDDADGRLIRFAASDAVSPAVAEAWVAARIAGGAAVGGFHVLAEYPLSEAPMLIGRRSGCNEDDHGDTFACASRLDVGRRTSAELANGWGDDEDVYRFRLGRLRPVTVEATGEPLPRIALYDRFGQRLETAGFAGGRALVVRTLRAGEYFVRVSGEGPGTYEVTIE